jgi:hypothetical protein
MALAKRGSYPSRASIPPGRATWGPPPCTLSRAGEGWSVLERALAQPGPGKKRWPEPAWSPGRGCSAQRCPSSRSSRAWRRSRRPGWQRTKPMRETNVQDQEKHQVRPGADCNNRATRGLGRCLCRWWKGLRRTRPVRRRDESGRQCARPLAGRTRPQSSPAGSRVGSQPLSASSVCHRSYAPPLRPQLGRERRRSPSLRQTVPPG